MDTPAKNETLTEILIGKYTKIKIGETIREGLIYKKENATFPYELLIKKGNRIEALIIGNKGILNGELFESKYLYTVIYIENNPSIFDKNNQGYIERDNFIQKSILSQQFLKKII